MNLYKTFRREGQLFQLVPQDQFVPACGYKSDRQCAFLPVFVGDVLIHDPMDCTDIPISCQPQDCGGVWAVWLAVAEGEQCISQSAEGVVSVD